MAVWFDGTDQGDCSIEHVGQVLDDPGDGVTHRLAIGDVEVPALVTHPAQGGPR